MAKILIGIALFFFLFSAKYSNSWADMDMNPAGSNAGNSEWGKQDLAAPGTSDGEGNWGKTDLDAPGSGIGNAVKPEAVTAGSSEDGVLQSK